MGENTPSSYSPAYPAGVYLISTRGPLFLTSKRSFGQHPPVRATVQLGGLISEPEGAPVCRLCPNSSNSSFLQLHFLPTSPPPPTPILNINLKITVNIFCFIY